MNKQMGFFFLWGEGGREKGWYLLKTYFSAHAEVGALHSNSQLSNWSSDLTVPEIVPTRNRYLKDIENYTKFYSSEIQW